MVYRRKKIDPIATKFSKPLNRAKQCENILFYIAALLSYAILVITDEYPTLFDIFQKSFPVTVVMLSITTAAIKLYFSPRAQEHRYRDFLSHAYNIPLGEEQTKQYYINKQTQPSRRIAAQTLENSHCSKLMFSELVAHERIKTGIYASVWLALIVYRMTDLNIIAVITQVVFSDLILIKWLKTEWFFRRCENTFVSLSQLFEGKIDKTTFEIRALEITCAYEMAKAVSTSTAFSEKIYERKRDEMEQGWKKIRKKLNI